MKIDEEVIKKQLAYIKSLVISFNRQPSAATRLELAGATKSIAILLDCAVDIHFSENDPNFLTYIRLYRGSETLYTISALASKVEIPVNSGLGKIVNE